MEEYLDNLKMFGTKHVHPNLNGKVKKLILPGQMANDMLKRKLEPRQHAENAVSKRLASDFQTFLNAVEFDTMSRICETADGRNIDAARLFASRIRRRQRRIYNPRYEIIQCEDEPEPNNVYVAYKDATSYKLIKIYGRKEEQQRFFLDPKWKVQHSFRHDIVDNRNGDRFQTLDYYKTRRTNNNNIAEKVYRTHYVFPKQDVHDQLLEVCETGWRTFQKSLVKKIH